MSRWVEVQSVRQRRDGECDFLDRVAVADRHCQPLPGWGEEMIEIKFRRWHQQQMKAVVKLLEELVDIVTSSWDVSGDQKIRVVQKLLHLKARISRPTRLPKPEKR